MRPVKNKMPCRGGPLQSHKHGGLLASGYSGLTRVSVVDPRTCYMRFMIGLATMPGCYRVTAASCPASKNSKSIVKFGFPITT